MGILVPKNAPHLYNCVTDTYFYNIFNKFYLKPYTLKLCQTLSDKRSLLNPKRGRSVFGPDHCLQITEIETPDSCRMVSTNQCANVRQRC